MWESFDACTYHRYNYRFFCQRIPLRHIRRPDINNETWFIAISKAFVSQAFLRSAICEFFLIFINKYINTFVTNLHSLTIMNKFQNSLQNNNVKKSGSFTRTSLVNSKRLKEKKIIKGMACQTLKYSIFLFALYAIFIYISFVLYNFLIVFYNFYFNCTVLHLHFIIFICFS